MLPRVFELGFAGVDIFFALSGFILLTVHPALGTADGPFYWLGQVSFGLYLLHEPVISAVGKLPPESLALGGLAASPLREAIVFAVALAGAALTHRWIEEPGRRLPERLGLLQSRPAFRDGIRPAISS